MTITTLIIAATAATLSPPQEDREGICYTAAEFHVTTVEARERGVPIDKVLDVVREGNQLFPGIETFVEMMRETVVLVYSQPTHGIKLNPVERRQEVNRLTAQCLIDWDVNDRKADWERAK